MTETATIDRKPTRSRPSARVKSAATGNDAKIVSASVMAGHLDVARSYLRKLVDDGVVAQLPDGRFDLDRTRVAFIRHLRRERRASPGNEAQQEHTRAKTALLQLRLEERAGVLMKTEEAMEFIDEMVGLFITRLNSMPARIGERDLNLRRKVERIVFEIRTEIANHADAEADRLEKLQGNPDDD